jgi:hypothetical protein
MGRTTEASAVARSGLARSRATASDLEAVFVFSLGNVARLQSEASTLAAYMREVELAAGVSCARRAAVREELATARLWPSRLRGAGSPKRRLRRSWRARAPATSARANVCALGVAVDDDRALAVTRDAQGHLSAELTTRTVPDLVGDRLVPPDSRARLAGCASVRVYALPPLHGLAAILPPDVAWGYASSAAAREPPPALRARRLVVSDVAPPPALGLAPLASWRSGVGEASWVHGAAATPSRVLAELEGATEVEIHAHGFVDAAQSAASLVALSHARAG